MLPHIPLFTKEHGCILLFLRVCIREKCQRACGVTESSYLPHQRSMGLVEKRSEDLWGTMPKNRVSPKGVTDLWSVLQSESVALTWGKARFLPHPLIQKAFLVFVPPVLVFLVCQMDVKSIIILTHCDYRIHLTDIWKMEVGKRVRWSPVGFWVTPHCKFPFRLAHSPRTI